MPLPRRGRRASGWAFLSRSASAPRFFYSKSLNCCIEIRGLLDDGSGTVCPQLFTAPCREFVGDCADVQAQFSGVQDGLPEEYECHQFPDEANPTDKIVVSLISCAVAIPFTYIMLESFAKANEPEFAECQLSWPNKLRVIKAQERWNWAQTKPPLWRRKLAQWAHEINKFPPELFAAYVTEPLEEWWEEWWEEGSDEGSTHGGKGGHASHGSGGHGAEHTSHRGAAEPAGHPAAVHDDSSRGGSAAPASHSLRPSPRLWDYLRYGPFARQVLDGHDAVGSAHSAGAGSQQHDHVVVVSGHGPGGSVAEETVVHHSAEGGRSGHASKAAGAASQAARSGARHAARSGSSQVATHRSGSHAASEGEHESDDEEEYEEGVKGAQKRVWMRYYAVGLFYTAWAIMTWIIFVYGASSCTRAL